MNRSTRSALALIVALACPCIADADIMVGDTWTVHTDVFGWCVTETLRVHTVSTFGHDPGEMWARGSVISVTIRKHETDSTATANDPAGLVSEDVMLGINTSVVGVNQLAIAMSTGTIARSRFADPNGILSGDVSWEFPSGISGIMVPNVVGVVHSFSNGFAPAFNFNPGDGFVMSDDDPEYTGVIDGNVFTPIPAPGAAALVALVATVGLARRRR